MKKFLCTVLTTGIILSASLMVTYADSSKGKADSKENPADVIKTTVQTSDTTAATEEQNPTVAALKEQLKEAYKDKALRKDLIQKIYEIRKQNKQETKMILVNGREVTSDVPPVIKYGRTLIPVRALTNALGATVEWDDATKTVTITKDGIVIEITLGSKIALVNGKEVDLGVPAETYNNRTIVPVRFISETFKNTVEYDEATGTVAVEDGTSTTPPATETSATPPVTGTDAANAPAPIQEPVPAPAQ